MKENYFSLLASTDNFMCQNSEFIELNKMNLCCSKLDENDYAIFWGCMKLYEIFEVNYFESYLKVINHQFGSFSIGIEGLVNSYGREFNPWQDDPNENFEYRLYLNHLTELIDILIFFGISHYQEKSILELHELLECAPESYLECHKRFVPMGIDKKKQKKEELMEAYFNFDDFSNDEFAYYVERCTIKCENESVISITDALKLAQNMPEHTYIVIFKRGGAVCYVGQTMKLLTYIGERHIKYNADRVVFVDVAESYINDVQVATTVYYDLPVKNMKVVMASRKYGTVKRACLAYKELESWPRRMVMSVIENSKLRIIDIVNGQELIDKIELERCIQKFTNC